MQISASNFIIYIGLIQGVILGLSLLCSKYFKSRANKYLAATILIVVLTSFLYSLIEAGTENVWIILVNDIMWEYLFPVTLLLYFAVSLNHPIASSPKRYWLYAPFILTLLFNVFIDLDLDFKLYDLNFLINDYYLDIYYAIEQVGVFVFSLLIIFWSRKIILNSKSKVETDWFKSFWFWASCLMLFHILSWLIQIIFNHDLFPFLHGTIAILFFWITYTGFLKFNLLVERFEIKEKLNHQPTPMESVSDVVAPIQDEYFTKLKKMMEEAYLYRNPELKRELVAKKLGISVGYLSQKLKENTDLNFSEFVNIYRVEEVKRLLVDPDFDAYSILAIGYEAGFNSKSTYYASFKKVTGLSPTAYRQRSAIPSEGLS